jgi:uncharacterized membrane protein YdbT with pleckstrin-like domain
MNDSDPRLITGESVVFSTSKHWAAPVADSKWAILLVLAALVLGWVQPDATSGLLGFLSRSIELVRLGLFFGGVGWIIYNLVAWRTAEYAVTNRRVFCQEGVIRRRSSDALLSSLSDVRTSISAVGRALGYGSITLITASGAAGEDAFTSVRDVTEFKRNILLQKSAPTAPSPANLSATANGATPAPVPTPPLTTPAEITDTLERLAKLRDTGALTTEEYDAKKVELLSRL